MDEQTTVAIYEIYESPALVELGEFGEDTLGGGGFTYDAQNVREF